MATAVCATCVVHAHSVSHAHFSDTISLRDVQTSRARLTQGVCGPPVISLHPSSNCTRPQSAGQSFFGTRAPRSLASWPIPRTPQRHGKRKIDKIIRKRRDKKRENERREEMNFFVENDSESPNPSDQKVQNVANKPFRTNYFMIPFEYIESYRVQFFTCFQIRFFWPRFSDRFSMAQTNAIV